MNRFEAKIAKHDLALRRDRLQTLQVNVGRKCNQACRHCHVYAAPWRKEMMPTEVARRVANWISEHRPPVVDITGGAPELSEHFRFLVEISREPECGPAEWDTMILTEQSKCPSPTEPGIDFNAAVAQFYEVLYQFAYSLSGSASDAADLTQETYRVQLLKTGQIRNPEKLKSWLIHERIRRSI